MWTGWFRSSPTALWGAMRSFSSSHGRETTISMSDIKRRRLANPRYIINFPTKRHWRSGSRIEDIEAGLTDLTRVIREHEIGSIAVPPLGSGLCRLIGQQADIITSVFLRKPPPCQVLNSKKVGFKKSRLSFAIPPSPHGQPTHWDSLAIVVVEMLMMSSVGYDMPNTEVYGRKNTRSFQMRSFGRKTAPGNSTAVPAQRIEVAAS